MFLHTKPNQTVKIVFVGDMMLSNISSNKKPHLYKSANTPGKLIKNGVDPFINFSEILKNTDITIGNLECCITTHKEPVDKEYTFKANPRVIPLLKKYFDALSIANNHTYDFNTTGFMDTIQLLKKNNLFYFGGGNNIHEAQQPQIFTIHKNNRSVKIAILAYDNSIPNPYAYATENKCGYAYANENSMRNISKVKKEYNPDYLIFYVHWGSEYKKIAADEDQLKFGFLAIDYGADMVIGCHPHVTQNITIYKNKPIFYSLGNFVFHGFNEKDGTEENYDEKETSKGWVLECDLNPINLNMTWKIHIAYLDENGIPYYGGLENDISPTWK